MVLLRPNEDLIDGAYLLYALQSPLVQREILLNEGTGATVSNLRIPILSRIGIPTASPAEQRAVATILGSLDEKIELNRKMNATLEALARAIFTSWFVDFDPTVAKSQGRETGLSYEVSALFPSSLNEAAEGRLPDGWRNGLLGEVSVNKRRGVSHRDILENTSYIGLEHMPRRSIALERWGDATDLGSNKTQFQKGDLLFGKLRPYFHKVGVAPVNGVCSTDILVVDGISKEWSTFVLMHISSDALVSHTDRRSTGTKMPRASWADIAGYKIVIPPAALVAAYTAVAKPMTERIIASIHESHALIALRDALLPKLISGELRVADAERILAKTA